MLTAEGNIVKGQSFSSFPKNGVWLLQTSGSLYGALIGSILAFNVADFLGEFSFVIKCYGLNLKLSH